MAEQINQKRGRIIDQQDLNTIRRLIASHWDKGRSAISRTLCRQWNWYQANGSLKRPGLPGYAPLAAANEPLLRVKSLNLVKEKGLLC